MKFIAKDCDNYVYSINCSVNNKGVRQTEWSLSYDLHFKYSTLDWFCLEKNVTTWNLNQTILYCKYFVCIFVNLINTYFFVVCNNMYSLDMLEITINTQVISDLQSPLHYLYGFVLL